MAGRCAVQRRLRTLLAVLSRVCGLLDRSPHTLWGARHIDMANTEMAECIDHCILMAGVLPIADASPMPLGPQRVQR